MVAGQQSNNLIIEKLTEVYSWLDDRISESNGLAGKCSTCGRCCDFGSFDHKLFITPPELMYLTANIGTENTKPMTTSRCPYNINGKCEIYKYRFAGCRIFYCRADKDFQSKLSESVMKKFKSLCTDFQISYRYTDLKTALENFAH